MGNNRLEIVRDKRMPCVKCPGCGAELQFDVMPFRYNPNMVVESACPACMRRLFAALMIPVSLKMEDLNTVVEAMVRASGVTNDRLLRRKGGGA